ncbi:MAG TPA: CAP domain-containing protein [Thermoanaerobaculia bacterium]|nr:CAP domain-containing protein [Thermoanaerobaculia bacterium]
MPRLTCLFFLFAALFIPSHQVTAAYSPQTLLQATNQVRADHQLPALTSNAKLTTAAQAFANNLANANTFSHAGLWTTLNTSGYRYTYAGQNLARHFTDTESTVTAWLNSPTHRANLLSTNYTETGIAMASSSNGDIYVVQYFAKPSHAK